MKAFILFLSVFLTQCSPKPFSNVVKGTSVTEDKGKGNTQEYEFKLKKVIADSRCPEGLNCVWEGQVEMLVAVYKANQLIEEKKLIVNSQTKVENASWANKYSNKPITFIGITPNRVKDQDIKEEDYKLFIQYN